MKTDIFCRLELCAGVLLAAIALKAAAVEQKPGLTELNPRGVQRGETVQLRLSGSNLLALTAVKFGNTNFATRIIDTSRTNEAVIEVTPAATLTRGAYEFSVASTNSESGKLKFYVDDVPQFFARETNPVPRRAQQPQTLPHLPVSVWGALENPGDMDAFAFEAKAGETLVFDLAAKTVGSKIVSGELVVLDPQGRVMAENSGFDGGDALLTFTPAKAASYTVRVSDRTAAGSKQHFYRLTIGTLPYVTGVYPLGVPANETSAVQLIGYNLAGESKPKDRNSKSATDQQLRASVAGATVKAGGPGEEEVPIDAERFRSRRAFKVIVSGAPELSETEPNDGAQTANAIQIPGAVNGRFWSPQNKPEADVFRFHAAAGRKLVIETQAAQRGSPADTKIEVVDAAGKPIPRALLQAVRDSFINFRGIDSNQQGARLENWEEMDLNQFIYLNGDVARLFRMPQGPDSDLLFYASAGKRRAFFDTTATGHALEEPCYVVEPRTLGEKLVANGLPVFTLFYANDDDGERKLGTDSKLYFTPTTDAHHLVRLSDSRGFNGDRFVYRLVVRDAKPDFKITLTGANPTVPRGSGQSFSVAVDRLDGFEGEIRVAITNVPAGFIVSSPLVIEAGQSEAKGNIFALTNANSMTNSAIKVTATASLNGQLVSKEVNGLGIIKVGDAPKLFVALEPYTSAAETNIVTPDEDKPFEITIAPGQTVPAWLKIKRNGHADLVTFQVENLPHGVIVDNIGLNGVLIPKDQNERQIFLTCAKWVGDMDRLCYAIEQNAGKQTSQPLLLKVRKAAPQAAVK
jgi:hypothetical protein